MKLSSIPLSIYQAAYYLQRKHIPVVPMCLVVFNRIVFSCYVGLGAKIGVGTTLGYGGLGIVIHHKAVIGARVAIGSNVTVGGRSGLSGVPVIGDDVVVGSGAKILGPITIGNGCKVGANAVVITDLPPLAVAVGVPAKIKLVGD